MCRRAETNDLVFLDPLPADDGWAFVGRSVDPRDLGSWDYKNTPQKPTDDDDGMVVDEPRNSPSPT